MGLLTPKDEAMLALGLGLLSSKGSFGNALGQAGMLSLNTLNQAQDRERVAKMRELQEEMARMNMETAKRQQAQMQRADEFRNSLQSPMQQNVAQALGGGGGPTVANAQKLQPVDPNQALMFDAMKAGLVDPVQYIASQRKDSTPLKVGAGETLLDPRTMKPVFSNPKEETTPSDWKLYQLSGAAARGVPFDQWDQARRRAGATSVSVNTGQKGFDNTLKLRGDFRSEPIYKAHNEVQSAHSQITTALKQASPAGDLAGATKIMKILDPGSVVRESELGMAMAATGMLDRVTNYAEMVIKGTKLTPDQRKDFQNLADKLLAESAKAYSMKRKEYQGIAERNQLNVDDVLGPDSAPAAMPTLDQIEAEIARRRGGR